MTNDERFAEIAALNDAIKLLCRGAFEGSRAVDDKLRRARKCLGERVEILSAEILESTGEDAVTCDDCGETIDGEVVRSFEHLTLCRECAEGRRWQGIES